MAQLVRAAWIDGLGDGRRLPDVIELSELYPNIDYRRASEYLDRYPRHQEIATPRGSAASGDLE
jgi:hypothetical protein